LMYSLSVEQDLRKVLSSALKHTTNNSQCTSKLYTPQTPIVIACPHEDQTSDSTTGREEAICSRNRWSGYSIVARFAILRKVEELVPAWLADGASYN
jgi:hypothetical protein